MSRWLRLFLCAALLAISWPAAAVDRLAEVRKVPPGADLVVPPGPIDLKVSAGLGVPQIGVVAPLSVETGAAASAVEPITPVIPTVPQAEGPAPILSADRSEASPGIVESAGPAPDPTAGWVESARRFDKASKAPLLAPVLGAGVPALVVGSALALPHLHSLAPVLDVASYGVANGLSVAFPMPDIYSTFRRGHAGDLPLGRALLGAAGTLALGLVNATVLGKPMWGVMHAFIALGLLAPYVIGKSLAQRGSLSRNRALLATAGVGALMLGLSAGLYFGAAAFVPALLAAHLSAAAVAQLLLWLQLAKGAMFVAVFAPDVAALLRGQPTKGFSKLFTSIYLASVAAFTFWGFSQAAFAPAGPIREQYLVHGLRNLCEAVAAALSLAAIHRSAKAAKARRP
ncbi:MAG: hypothetical protein HY077_07050 [Elusimicrobia bacterium]|nr:hypothetical protein [Elusimicrobiota bacterium]